MARPSNKEVRRQQIVEGLLSVMSEKGYDGASIQAIARSAELTPGLIHYHFKNKQEILLELVDQIRTVASKRYTALAEKSKAPQEKLKAFIDSRLALGKGADIDSVKAWVLIGAEAVRQPEVREVYDAEMADRKKLLMSLLKNASTKQLSNDFLDKLSGILLATMEGAFQLSVTSRKTIPRGTAAKSVMTIIENSI